MQKLNPVKMIIEKRKKGIPAGMYSICSANRFVLEAAMDKAAESGNYVLIEATANQVNQFGGYTGMKPEDFKNFVYEIADTVEFPKEKIILGGDHLGPLVWSHEKSENAMELSEQLIRNYVRAGFTKIHIDTSMHLADDDKDICLDKGLVAQRGAILCEAAEKEFEMLKQTNPSAVPPVYIIGSEVPTPGGSQHSEEKIKVTDPKDFEETVESYRGAFLERGLFKAWENVVAVVVQPGVEFGDDTIHEYDQTAASALCQSLEKYPDIVFEGHSTDYQTADCLKKMVEDGIAILKVGPALTFALREALFMLNEIENELFRYNPEILLSNFSKVLESAMLRNPKNWENHYRGTPLKKRFSIKFSLSDRSRYYFPVPEVSRSLQLLLSNLKTVHVPLTLVGQYMPLQYKKIRRGKLENTPEALLKDRVINVLDDYEYAISGKRGIFSCI